MIRAKKVFKDAIRQVLQKKGTDEVLSEAALPAYAHANPLIDYIFWKRLAVTKRYVEADFSKDCHILDLGCGTGVMSFELSNVANSIHAIDLDLRPQRILQEYIEFPKNIHFSEGDFIDSNFNNSRFDVIIALDVLEHIEDSDLPTYIDKMKGLLRPNGCIIVSGPTENSLYKIGRKFAGKDFTGHYHESNIATIKERFKSQAEVKTIARLIWPFTLFEVFVVK